jgi:uncharacterized membrane protein
MATPQPSFMCEVGVGAYPGVVVGAALPYSAGPVGVVGEGGARQYHMPGWVRRADQARVGGDVHLGLAERSVPLLTVTLVLVHVPDDHPGVQLPPYTEPRSKPIA